MSDNKDDKTKMSRILQQLFEDKINRCVGYPNLANAAGEYIKRRIDGEPICPQEIDSKVVREVLLYYKRCGCYGETCENDRTVNNICCKYSTVVFDEIGRIGVDNIYKVVEILRHG